MNERHTLVLLRHGHSEWNLGDRFTGWTDIPLTQVGLDEAENCGRLLAGCGFEFDEAHMSVLRRSRQTTDHLLKAARHKPVPYYSHWRLNERHYGRLQGMNKAEIFKTWGEQQSHDWWRGYSAAPPPLDLDDPRHPRFDSLYAEVDAALLPRSESLQQCRERTVPYWNEHIVPRLFAGKRLLIVSHGNTLRGLRMHVENFSDETIERVEIPSAVPLVYRFDAKMNLLGVEWLNDNSTHNLGKRENVDLSSAV